MLVFLTLLIFKMEDKKYFYFIGIDVSKKTLDISVNRETQHLFPFQVSNDLKGLKSLLKKLKSHKIDFSQTLFCAEKTGDYSHSLAQFLDDKKCDYWEENALKIKKSSGLQRGKNDCVDAQRIALYAYRYKDLVKLYQPKSDVLSKMEQLSAFRSLLIKISSMLKVFISEKSLSVDKGNFKLVKRFSRVIVLLINKTIKLLDLRLAELVKEDINLHQKHERAMSVPGIGPVVSMMLLIKTNGYQGVKSSKQLACYIGIAPFEYSSGTSIQGKTRVSVFGNKKLKSLMHMGTLSILGRKKGDLYDFYVRKHEGEGKHAMLVINALKNKQLARVFACIRDEKMYLEAV